MDCTLCISAPPSSTSEELSIMSPLKIVTFFRNYEMASVTVEVLLESLKIKELSGSRGSRDVLRLCELSLGLSLGSLWDLLKLQHRHGFETKQCEHEFENNPAREGQHMNKK
jgi:hypothetical protein